jgi:uncharacterized protein
VEHCKAVSQLAVEFAKRIKAKGIYVDIGLVRIGGLLHDIGRSKTHGVEHGYIGSEIASSLGLPEAITKIIERHVGSGIPASEAVLLNLPERDFLPLTLEEKLVSYADKLIDGKKRIEFDRVLDRFAIELGPTHPAVGRLVKLHGELIRIIGEP